ncbi:MAG: hypothetical protein F6J87_24925 [Spirulina sp. SIO3F2]|nr:hypothetical protein [Spirulina sp. SIO3F2]
MSANQPTSVWQLKPWWCQPWSIWLTGSGAIATSWLIFHRVWLTGLVGLPLTVWMIYFLLIYPRLFAQMMQESEPR